MTLSNTNEWRTPREVFDYWNAKYNFQLDTAAQSTNKLVDNYHDGLDNGCGIKTPWTENVAPGQWAWCNPPYSEPLKWVRKAIHEQARGVGTVMLLNADFSTKANRLATMYAQHAYITMADWHKGHYYNGRIAFYDDQGDIQTANRSGQVFYTFTPFGGQQQDIGGIRTSFVSILEYQPSKPPSNRIIKNFIM